jgi:hypothetical protein
LRASESDERAPVSELTQEIPTAPQWIAVRRIGWRNVERDERERAIMSQLLDGNLPEGSFAFC